MFCSVILSDGHLDHFGFCADPNDRSINVNQPELVLFLFCPECCSFAIAYLPQLLNCFDVILKLSDSFVVMLMQLVKCVLISVHHQVVSSPVYLAYMKKTHQASFSKSPLKRWYKYGYVQNVQLSLYAVVPSSTNSCVQNVERERGVCEDLALQLQCLHSLLSPTH